MSDTELQTGEYDVVVDEAIGDTLDDVMPELTAGLNVTWSLLAEHGNGGGHPTVTVTGTAKDLAIFEGRYNGDASFV